MGGGDLNLKKSWHPSTMKNMEKVWKAEQQDHQERKRIAELKREIEMEKDKEDMTKYAMDQGVIEKKEDKKLDWMYKGPNQGAINREDYLLGKPIDKRFEEMVQAKKDPEHNRAPKNHVEYECIPPSLRFFSGSEQVDLARKLQEDPLYAIKKKEMETKSQLLKNPVRLKQLRELLDQQSKKDKRDKRSKKQKKKNRSKSSSENENSDGNLDDLLAEKYRKLKGKINEDYLIKSMKRLKKEKKKRARKESSKSGSESSDEESEREERKQRDSKLKRNDQGRERETRRKECKKKQSDRSTSDERTKSNKYKNNKKRRNSESSENRDDDQDSSKKRHKNQDRERSQERSDYRNKSRGMQNRYENRDKSPRRKHNDSSRDTKESDDEKRRNPSKVEFGLMRADRTKVETHSRPESSRPSKPESRDKREEKRWVPPKKQRLTEEEKEKRRREMMDNASWRDRERETNVKRYREQEKKEQPDKTYNKDFLRKQLAAAAEAGSIESRIRANINNIQRSGRAMDTNFAKR